MLKYKTIKNQACDEFVEKKSKFIGYIKPVSSEEEAINFINEIKSKNWDATHNVYAYVLKNDQIKRYSDDGEPQGTAGIPVLDILQKNEIIDAVIVVTRYFGGIMLGAGGLVRAYSHCAKLALDAGKVIEKGLCLGIDLICDYNQYSKIVAAINEYNGFIDKSDFLESVKITFYLNKENVDKLKEKLMDITNGKIEINIVDEKFMALKHM